MKSSAATIRWRKATKTDLEFRIRLKQEAEA